MQVNKVTHDHLFKYRLKELWAKKFGDKSADMKKIFREQNGNLSEDTITRDFNARYTDAYKMPCERLVAYAMFLEMDVMQLKTHTILVAA